MLHKNDLFITFKQLKGNPKMSILTEPLWYIPYTLFIPFASLYMSNLGLSELDIGIVTSVGLCLQVVFAFIGGVITDKMGRRKATFIFDLLSWSVPCLIWGLAQNFWWFLLASIINASYQITNTSWNCLFVEDCPPQHLTNAFTLIQICGMMAIVVSPLSIIWVQNYGVVDVVRVVYLCSAVSMAIKFILLYVFGSETQTGLKRLEETKNISYAELFKGYKGLIKTILSSNKMLFVIFFMSLFTITSISTNTFLSLYITKRLGLSDELVALFPIFRTIIMILFVLVLQNFFNRINIKNAVIVGLLMYITSHLILLLAPQENVFFVSLYTILEAASYAVVCPRKDAIMAFYVDQNERSRIYALYNAGTIAIASPFGLLTGYLSELNLSFPFILNIVLFVLCMIMFCNFKDINKFDQQIQENC